jgi:hypothetical protein
MTTADLPELLLRFISSCIPTFPAAELLVFLSRHPDRRWSAEEIVNEVRPRVITVSAVSEYFALFKANGLMAESHDACFQYKPASDELKKAVRALGQAYDERPVTLIRTIYRIADSKIQSFADSFKLTKD